MASYHNIANSCNPLDPHCIDTVNIALIPVATYVSIFFIFT